MIRQAAALQALASNDGPNGGQIFDGFSGPAAQGSDSRNSYKPEPVFAGERSTVRAHRNTTTWLRQVRGSVGFNFTVKS
jgi:hypothetical protein